MLVKIRAVAVEVAGLKAVDAEDAVLYPILPIPFSFFLSLCSVPGPFPHPPRLPCYP